MRVSAVDQSAALAGVGYRDAESLFRAKPISEIRNVESNTRKQIEDKKEELRQLIGNRYRDLIDSADSILSMKSSCESISANISSISDSIFSLSSESPNLAQSAPHPSPHRANIYGIACRVKYLVDTPENIWGCLDESMFLEAAARYVRAKLVHQNLNLVNKMDSEGNGRILSKKFPLLSHQWQLVESFKAQIAQRSRERLLAMDKDVIGKLSVGDFADALAGVAVVDELDSKQAFSLFLDSRRSWIMQKLNSCGGSDSNVDGSMIISVFCEVTKILQVTLGQVGELFLQVLNDMPLFYKIILDCPPASQLFGGIPNPDEEVRHWNEFRDNLESVMVMLDREFIAKTCSNWLRECGTEIVKMINGKFLINSIASGEELASAEKLIRETMDSKHVLEGSLEWLRSVFGSDIELPWSSIRELVLEEDLDLWDEIFEDAFVQRMKVIIDSGFEDLNKVVNVTGSVNAVGESADALHDFQSYLDRTSLDGGVWFAEPNLKKAGAISGTKSLAEENDFNSCLNEYFGSEASRIRDAVDNCCQSVLGDLLCFLESPKASLRLKDLVPYLQTKCYHSISDILKDLNNEIEHSRTKLDNNNKEMKYAERAQVVEKSLFIGRLLFALKQHSKHVPLILGSPRSWISEPVASGPEKLTISRHSRISLDHTVLDNAGMHTLAGSRRQTSLLATALYGYSDVASPKLEELVKTIRDLCIASHGLWISWLTEELSRILSNDLKQDDGLSATTPLKGWEEIIVKQEQPGEADPEVKISLPCMPSLYVASFLFKACEEIHRVGGHVLDKTILQQLALRLLESVIHIYGDFIANHGGKLSEKGALQALLDLKFAADILSGADSSINEASMKSPAARYSYVRKQEHGSSKSVLKERVNQLVNRLAEKLDPIDWQTYEPYLWENEKQSYLRHAILFGYFVQLNRMYTNTVQKLPTNSESNLMRCSAVPRFKYLPISAPALSSRSAAKTPLRTSSDDITTRSTWKSTNGELTPSDFDENSSFGAATPFLKSFMQIELQKVGISQDLSSASLEPEVSSATTSLSFGTRVGSRFGESTFKLSSMLGDSQVGRFKDRSAAAMSTFGDILPMQASGLFSSLTATRSDS